MFKLRHFTDTWQILHYLKFLSSTVSIFPHPYGLVLSFFPFSNNGSESDVLDELLTFWLSVVALWRFGSVFAVILQFITFQHFYHFHFAVTQNHFSSSTCLCHFLANIKFSAHRPFFFLLHYCIRKYLQVVSVTHHPMEEHLLERVI